MTVNNSLIKKENKQTFSTFLTGGAVKNKINQIVGGKDGQAFITSILSAVSNNPTLSECEHGSILSAAMLGQSLKLSPSPQLGQYYLVPYNDKNKGKVAQFQLGYKGYIQLATRSGEYKRINVMAIKDGELVKYNPLEEEIEVNLIDDEEIRENTKTIGYYAMFEYMNGFKKTMYWPKTKMKLHADKYSQAFSLNATNGRYPKVAFEDFEAGKVAEKDMWQYSSYWYKDFDGMAFKTMLRQLISKWGVMSIDFQKAYESDSAVIKEDGTIDYIDNTPIESEAVEIETDTVEADAVLIKKEDENYIDPFQ